MSLQDLWDIKEFPAASKISFSSPYRAHVSHLFMSFLSSIQITQSKIWSCAQCKISAIYLISKDLCDPSYKSFLLLFNLLKTSEQLVKLISLTNCSDIISYFIREYCKPHSLKSTIWSSARLYEILNSFYTMRHLNITIVIVIVMDSGLTIIGSIIQFTTQPPTKYIFM